LAFAYKKSSQNERAIEYFGKTIEEKDTLSQYAFYQMAESYLALDKKMNARTAFEKCLALGFNDSLNEQSLFNSAKLSYETSNNGMALDLLGNFIKKYPKSKYIGEAKSLISNLLLTSKNYKEAIRILESIEDKDDEDLNRLQKIYYYRAEELYLQNDYKTATTFFDKVISSGNYNKQMMGLSNFWLAEIAYKETLYTNSINLFKKAQAIDEFKSTRFFDLSFYSLGYANLKSENYKGGIEAFKKYIERDVKIANPEVYTDAVTRTADCYFAEANYGKALEYYNLVVNKNLNGSDYALYQIAMIQGVVKKPLEKINTLSSLITKYPKSIFIDDALFEKADEQLKSENYQEALNWQ
jgi:tetratricopeptide (TPR) repeat protein